jgi:hypothetical protein
MVVKDNIHCPHVSVMSAKGHVCYTKGSHRVCTSKSGKGKSMVYWLNETIFKPRSRFGDLVVGSPPTLDDMKRERDLHGSRTVGAYGDCGTTQKNQDVQPGVVMETLNFDLFLDSDFGNTCEFDWLELDFLKFFQMSHP